ncbi:NB-ARC domain-containing protein [Cylindrospermum sp. FACHB-282]|uniref:NB-ARC domain-containing protein n=1 Tax=Cylindrospermum sp. FACHB-282 TaxID=2692794 RepID=UPI0016871750|nr:NB-ARC domain-containing protein [Cylindrospermum sp. FACHB-282]MBD2385609.1 NB-ARC domain-containing protein [Cylindrospermum sp. FACHB-282]
MLAANSTQIEAEFIEAKNNWELEKLYVDLASVKGKALTPVEKKFLRGLLCGCSPAEIASIVYKSRSSSTVRVYLSNGIYKYIEEMLSNQVGHSVKVKSWSRVTHLLEKAGYKKNWFQVQSIITPIKTTRDQETDLLKIKSATVQDWGEAIDVSLFHGRTTELATVTEWIFQERCRLVVVLGMGGIGKTAFSVKLAEEIQDKFEYVIWRSLRFAPPLGMILDQVQEILSPKTQRNIADTIEGKISQLIDCLRLSRCLLVFDNFDSILCSDDADDYLSQSTTPANTSIYALGQIRYRPGYEGYGELIRRVGESQHQSCLLLTSRDKPPETAAIEGDQLPVHSLKLTGLSKQESTLILKTKGFSDFKQEECSALTDWYAGNPLFIKIVATTIQELFDGSILEFLSQGTVVFGDIRGILDEQFNRLSVLEKRLIYWLALNQDFVFLQDLANDIIPELSPRLSQRLMLEAIELLQRRSLIEKAAPTPIEKQVSSFYLTPLLIEYVTERLMEEKFKLSKEEDNSLFINHTIFAAQIKNHIGKNRLNGEI